jgi:hypothetical protein
VPEAPAAAAAAAAAAATAAFLLTNLRVPLYASPALSLPLLLELLSVLADAGVLSMLLSPTCIAAATASLTLL